MTATCTVCELHAESTFKIEGMDCREEVTLLERRFSNLAGLEDFSADVMGQRLHVKYDAARLSTATIADAVADTGMRAWLEHEEPVVGTAPDRARRRARRLDLRCRAGGRPGPGRRRAPCPPVGAALRRVDRRGDSGGRPPRLAVRCGTASSTSTS